MTEISQEERLFQIYFKAKHALLKKFSVMFNSIATNRFSIFKNFISENSLNTSDTELQKTLKVVYRQELNTRTIKKHMKRL